MTILPIHRASSWYCTRHLSPTCPTKHALSLSCRSLDASPNKHVSRQPLADRASERADAGSLGGDVLQTRAALVQGGWTLNLAHSGRF